MTTFHDYGNFLTINHAAITINKIDGHIMIHLPDEALEALTYISGTRYVYGDGSGTFDIVDASELIQFFVEIEKPLGDK